MAIELPLLANFAIDEENRHLGVSSHVYYPYTHTILSSVTILVSLMSKNVFPKQIASWESSTDLLRGDKQLAHMKASPSETTGKEMKKTARVVVGESALRLLKERDCARKGRSEVFQIGSTVCLLASLPQADY